MADNISNFLPPSSIRLSVEPAEVELESADASLLFSALQSAFPQSTGIYFRPKGGGNCRVMLKFDGRRFLPPNGGWNGGVEYFVELAAGSRPSPFPFGSYEHASKQFERSVNLVQQMMNGTSTQLKGKAKIMGNGGNQLMRRIDQQQFAAAADGDRRMEIPLMETSNGQPPHHQLQKQQQQDCLIMDGRMEENDEQHHHHQHDDLTEERKLNTQPRRKSSSGLTELTLTSSCSVRDVKSVERDFADLARICAGKDAVIDGQRMELDGMKTDLDRLKATEAEWTEKEAEWKAKWEAAERELQMLRALGKDQQGLHGQLVELGRKLEMERTAWEMAKSELEMEMRKWQREAQEWKDKSELGTWTINELTEQLKRAQREKADLQKKAAILEEQVNGEAMEFGRRFQERERIQQELLTDNTRLYQIKDQLELQCREFKEKLGKLNGECDKRMDEIKAEYEAKEHKLCDNLSIADSRAAQMEAKIVELTRQNVEAQKQIRALKNHSELGNSEPLFAYSQG